MKISKLFHWLYAFLMFLPVLALAPSLFYFAFNQQSQNYTDVQVNETYEYETNEVNSVDDLVEGNIYHFEYASSDNLTLFFGIHYVFNLDTNVNITFANTGSMNTANIQPASFYVYGYNEVINQPMRMYNNNNGSNYTISFDFTYEVIQDENQAFKNNCQLVVSASDYLGEKTVDVVRSEQSPMNIFYTAVNYVYDMPVFSWAKNSFLALPITYVTGLFGMASNNVVNYYLSYWLAISIVYLVFDLVMYVPLLVHRWIDKGMIE